MSSFHYPIKVIRKKLVKPNYKPIAVDCSTGGSIKLNSTNRDSFRFLGFQIVLLIIPLLLVHFIVIDPLIQTSMARSAVEDSLESLSKEDANTIAKLQTKGNLVSESTDSGLVTLVVSMEKTEMKESLELAFSLTTLKEVSTDGKTISVSFLSSGK